MKKKIVLHIVESLAFGGVESRMEIVGAKGNLSRFRHNFCVISRAGAVSARMVASGNSVTILNRRSRIPSLTAILALIRHIRRTKPAIIHCHGAEANFHGIIAGRICRTPVCIAEEIGLPNHTPKARLVFRWVYKLADSVVAISEAVKRKVVELKEVEAEKCHVILNPTQMLPQRNDPTPSDRFRIGFVGRLEEIKNPLGLVSAVSLLRAKGLNITLTIVGDGSQRKFLEEDMRRLDLADVLSLAGFDPRPFDRLTDVDLYVQPSISEGFGLALVEAMSMGIPVLATAVGGTPEIITHGKNGWLLNGTGPEEIAGAIEYCMMLDSHKMKTVGANGRSSVVERFAPATYFSNCDALYEHLLKLKDASGENNVACT